MSDIAKIKPSERIVEIVDPGTRLPIGIRVGLLSIDDGRLIKIKRQITDESQRLQQRGKFFKAEELENNTIMLIFQATTHWQWYNPTGKEGDEGYDPDAMPEFEGEVPEYNQKNVIRILSALTWFKKQLIEEIEDEKAFFTNSAPS